MKIAFYLMITLGVVLSGKSDLLADQEVACLDQAQTQQEIDRCLEQTYTPLGEQISIEFKRLAEKFKTDNDMQQHLESAKQAWNQYHIYQCMLEAEVAGYLSENTRQVVPPTNAPKSNRRMSLQASRAASRCAIRTVKKFMLS